MRPPQAPGGRIGRFRTPWHGALPGGAGSVATAKMAMDDSEAHHGSGGCIFNVLHYPLSQSACPLERS
jgi:hypothetical protein